MYIKEINEIALVALTAEELAFIGYACGLASMDCSEYKEVDGATVTLSEHFAALETAFRVAAVAALRQAWGSDKERLAQSLRQLRLDKLDPKGAKLADKEKAAA